MSENQQSAQPESSPEQIPQKSNRTLLIVLGAGGGALLLCLCVAVVGIFIYLDPLGLRGDPIARNMPAGTNVYVAIDVQQLTSENTARIADAFAEAADGDIRDTADFFDQLDDELNDSFGFTFTDDILSWIGGRAGIGLMDFELDSFGEPQVDEFVVVVEVRDTGEADAFVDKLVKALEDEIGERANDSEYKGAIVYEIDGGRNNSAAVARKGRVLILATSANLVEESIDASSGDSLARSPAFRETVKALPKKQLMTLYANQKTFEAFSNYYESELLQGSSSASTFKAYSGMAIGLGIGDDHIRVDVATTIDEGALTEDQQALLEAGGGGDDLIAFYPEETLMFANGAHLDLIWESYEESLHDILGDSEYDEIVGALEEEIGFNLGDDLFVYLDGGWAFGAFSSTESYFNDELDLPIDYLFIAETSSVSEIDGAAGEFAGWWENEVGDDVSESSGGEGHYYEIFSFSQLPVSAFGTRDNYLLIGGSSDTLAGAFDLSSTLSSSESYQQIAGLLGRNVTPAFYVDFQRLLDLIEITDEFAETDSLRPILAAAIGSGSSRGNTSVTSLIIVVDVK